MERDGEDFLISSAAGITIAQYAALYGASHEKVSLTGTLRAEDGRGRSDTADFTLTLRHDASARFQSPAVHQDGQRWAVAAVYETYEGPQAANAMQIPWKAVAAGARTWHAGLPAGTTVKCRDHGGTRTENWPAAGAEDSSLFTAAGDANTASGNATLSFKAAHRTSRTLQMTAPTTSITSGWSAPTTYTTWQGTRTTTAAPAPPWT